MRTLNGAADKIKKATPSTGRLRRDWLEKKILFVSGKGGVGKSMVAAAVAEEAARDGRKTLLVELGNSSYFKDFWDLPEVTHIPAPVIGGYDLALWSGETCLREYVLHYLRIERLYSIFFENKVMRSLINVAPGLSEIAIVGKIVSGIRRVGPALDYDLIVVDAYATGHALALLRASRGMAEAVRFGPMGSQSREIDAILKDPALCAYWTVTLFEDLPVAETIEFAESLRATLGVGTSVIGNKVVQAPVDGAELGRVGLDKDAVGEFARYLASVTSRQTAHAEALTAAGLAPACTPLIYSNHARELVAAVGDALRFA